MSVGSRLMPVWLNCREQPSARSCEARRAKKLLTSPVTWMYPWLSVSASEGCFLEQETTYRGAHKLDCGDGTLGHDPGSVTALRTIGNDSSFDISNCNERGQLPFSVMETKRAGAGRSQSWRT